MTELAIRVDGLTRDFDQMRAIDHISLEVSMGSIFGFLGPNGAGKTTTINLLLGLPAPTSGTAAVLGFDTAKDPDQVRAHMAWGFALVNLVISLVAVNVANADGGLLMLTPLLRTADLLISFLVAILAVSVGVVISLRSIEVHRQVVGRSRFSKPSRRSRRCSSQFR